VSELDLLALDRVLRAGELGGPTATSRRPPEVNAETLSALRSNASDPLAVALEPWVFRLLEKQTLAGEREAVSRAYCVARHTVHEPEYAQRSLSELFGAALAERAARSQHLQNFFGNASELSSLTLRYWSARVEFASSLAVELDTWELALPNVAEHAASWLSLSRDAFAEFGLQDPAQFLTAALAEDATRGWPSRLSLRGISELLSDGRWFDGLELRIPALPRAHGAASFLRGLAMSGGALSEATLSERVPFAFAGDLFCLQRHTWAALFAYLPLSPVFLRRKLGLGPSHLQDTLRALGRSILLESRVAALRVLLRTPLLAGSARLLSAFAELSVQALGFELPKAAALTFVRVHRDDAQRFLGMLYAATRFEQLIQTHDDDWYRNPRAIAELRQQAEEPLKPSATAELAQAGARDLYQRLSSLL
jgi:hypothetical protein